MDWFLFWAAVGSLAALIGAVAGAALYLDSRLKRISDQNEQQLRESALQAKRQDEFESDWYGEPARAGVDARPGMMERVRNIEKELHPNGGSTMRDAINETRATTGELRTGFGELRAAFDGHLRNHSAMPSVRVDLQPPAPTT